MVKHNPIKITLPKIELGIWMPILGHGIGIALTSDCQLKSILCDQLCISPGYLESRIQTILVNGKAVDDVNQVQVADGDIIALSAAMPGLAGATLRRGSHLAQMRGAITHPCASSSAGEKSAGSPIHVVILKLFNLVAKEIGPRLLRGSILLRERDIGHLMARYPNLSISYPETKKNDWIEVHISVNAFESNAPQMDHNG